MAITAKLETSYGERRSLYVRLNNLDTVSNHDAAAVARFRGYISEAAFNSGKGFVWERLVEFDADVTQPLWAQAYSRLKTQPQQDMPVEPQAPEMVADGANDDEKAAHANAQAQYDAAYAAWQEASAQIGAANTEVAALANGFDID